MYACICDNQTDLSQLYAQAPFIILCVFHSSTPLMWLCTFVHTLMPKFKIDCIYTCLPCSCNKTIYSTPTEQGALHTYVNIQVHYPLFEFGSIRIRVSANNIGRIFHFRILISIDCSHVYTCCIQPLYSIWIGQIQIIINVTLCIIFKLPCRHVYSSA